MRTSSSHVESKKSETPSVSCVFRRVKINLAPAPPIEDGLKAFGLGETQVLNKTNKKKAN